QGSRGPLAGVHRPVLPRHFARVESRRYTTMTETTETLVKFADRSEKIIAFIEDRVTEMRNEQVAVNVAAEAGDVEAFNAAVVRLGALAERIKMAIDGDPDNVDEALAEE